ncbi:uncharacterized protein EAF01_011648 [Botrytis porri]|uniref:uncharacterized protein n=1 Tax=Botrytis porri TaxID=87229 RepID=UPI0019011359|nr:uncharacterized protein EAF01_011648 [Botrytis porri]KAF7883139.1 hypothetical protein EAF01_011648 [Botrytis porri]
MKRNGKQNRVDKCHNNHDNGNGNDTHNGGGGGISNPIQIQIQIQIQSRISNPKTPSLRSEVQRTKKYGDGTFSSALLFFFLFPPSHPFPLLFPPNPNFLLKSPLIIRQTPRTPRATRDRRGAAASLLNESVDTVGDEG